MREWGIEQLVRDARIAQIYEGTNGVQAMDLVGRKLAMEGGSLPRRFFSLIRETIRAGAALPGSEAFTAPIAAALGRLETVTDDLTRRAESNLAELGAAATEYLRLMALVSLGWMWGRMALHALALGEAAQPVHRQKLAVARFYMARLLPQTLGLEATISAGATTLITLKAEDF